MLIAYLSDEWIAAAAEILAASTISPPIDGDGFSIETVVTGGPHGDSSHIVELDGQTIGIRRPHPGEAATVRLTQSYEVSVQVATGTQNAQTAFLNAEIQVSGDVSRLIANAAAVGVIGDALAPLRERTEFPAQG